jgi:transcriptional regulator of acetoin/glycerol metabolism
MRTMGETVSDVFVQARRPEARQRPVLYVAFQIDDLAAVPSRHDLEGVEVVCFGRGPRAAIRREIDGKSGLEIQVPDPMMSSLHGRLAWIGGTWQFDDSKSKNGAVIDGRLTRLMRVERGAVIQLGRTIFLFDQATLTDGRPDITAAPLAPPMSELVTLHARFAADLAELERVATQNVPMLLLGETGTGKEVVARAVHALSHRRGPLVAVNCGAIPSTLVEAELFGHKKGAFSGAASDRMGHLRAAAGGTLFLDEIGELSLAAQTALLRALQQREVVPVGESLPVPVDVRIIAATHRDLLMMLHQERFREDLYARLQGMTITLPPLRERRFDLGILIATLLRRLDPSGRARVTPPAARALFAYAWPHNVRELERALAVALARSADGSIGLEHLPDAIATSAEVPGAEVKVERVPPPSDAVDSALRDAIIDALMRHGGNVTAAAKALGKHREQLHRWAHRLGIDINSFRSGTPSPGHRRHRAR